jgi:hypothetical protein
VLDESDLQRMTPEERARLARALASLNAQSLTPTPLGQRRLELLAGSPGPVPSFWQVPLFGDCPGSYRTLLSKPPDLVSTDAAPAQGAELAGQDTG